MGAENRSVGGAPAAGAAYVFTRSGAGWSQQAEITAPDAAGPAPGSAPRSNSLRRHGPGRRRRRAGRRAAQRRRSLRLCAERHDLVAAGRDTDPDGAAGDWFGSSLPRSPATSADRHGGATVGGKSEAGAAYVFGRGGTGWTQLARITALDTGYGGDFGTSVDLAGDTALVGAPGRRVGGAACCPAPPTCSVSSPLLGEPHGIPDRDEAGPARGAQRHCHLRGCRLPLVAIRRKVGERLVLLKQLRLFKQRLLRLDHAGPEGRQASPGRDVLGRRRELPECAGDRHRAQVESAASATRLRCS